MAELDAQTLVIGPPKHGKTSILHDVCERHLTSYPTGVALVHDVNRQFVDLCARYENVADYRGKANKAALAGEPFPRGASFGCDTSEIAELALELGVLHNEDTRVTVPILLIYDETSLMETSGSTWVSKLDLKIIANRRHRGIHPAYNLQRHAGLMDAFFELATDVCILSQVSDENTRALEKKIGMKPGALARLVGAPKYTYVHWRQGEGCV